MMFIKLTQWNAHRYNIPGALNNEAHGRAIYINALLITDIYQFNNYVYHDKTDISKPFTERKTEVFTEINLCTRGQEDQATRMVQETPEQIIELIKQEMKK